MCLRIYLPQFTKFLASNHDAPGTLYFVSELKGLEITLADTKNRLTNEKVIHNGCVRVDDEGWSLGKVCSVSSGIAFIVRRTTLTFLFKHMNSSQSLIFLAAFLLKDRTALFKSIS